MNVRRYAFAVLFAAAVVVMLTASTHRRRQMQRRLQEQIYAVDRHVDARVRLNVVVRDNNGTEFLPGKPKLRIIRTHTFGGWIDTKTTPPRLLTNEEKPFGPGRDWYCSEDQEPIILHDDGPTGSLVLGGMGAGKTTAGVMWLYRRWLENLGTPKCEGAITAPTNERLDVVFDEIKGTWPANWYHIRVADRMLIMCDGTRIRGISTHRQSAAQGSRIQGFSWWFWLGDELQDQLAEFIHVQARLRGIGDGSEKRLGTVTAKDDSDWREFLDQRRSDPHWRVRQMLGPNTPFKHAAHWESLRASMSLNEYKRLVLAEDLPSELAVYYGWNRTRNLVVHPRIATDVTAAVLAGYRSYLYPGRAFGLGIGHDPGVIFNTSEIFRLVMFGDIPTWLVVGELQTKQTTAREHAQQLAKYLRDTFYVNNPSVEGPLACAFIDPHGRGDTQTDYQSVYMAFQKEGIDAFNPAPMTKRIPRKARVEMVNRLMAGTGSSGYEPRLVIAKNEQGAPVAPVLVSSFEQLKKRPGDDNPEGTQRKDEDDKTHAPAGCSYFLWPFEQEAITAHTQKTAHDELLRRRRS